MTDQRVQRRLAAILVADVVGYSRLMEADEADTLARLKALRADFLYPKIDAYRGRHVNTIGDSTLMEFSSAVDAVQYAIDVQQELARRNADTPESARIMLRMGINVGDVIIDDEGIYGDGVNIAARLEAFADPGGVYLSAMAYEGVRKKLDITFDDLGEQSFKNIADPVRVYRVAFGDPSPMQRTRAATDAIFRRPAVAVLPFDNLSGDPEQDYFADGLTEDLITALSLRKTFPVIARNSVFTYKKVSRDLRKVGDELGARYVIEGSVRKAGQRVRVTAQLINASTGHHVWAERYDRNLEDIFAVQDEISAQIAGTVSPELDRAEHGRLQSRNPSSMGAWELFQRGVGLFNRFTKEDISAAREMFAQALTLDPAYARACAYLAFTHHVDLWLEFTASRAHSLAQLSETSRRAVALDVSDAFGHMMCSTAAMWLGNHQAAVAEAEEAVALNPSSSEINGALGVALEFVGRSKDAVVYFERALRLSPHDPSRGLYHVMIARSQATAGFLDAAIDSATRALERQPNVMEAHLILVSSLARLGRQAEAEDALRKARAFRPDGVPLPPSWSRYAVETPKRDLVDGLRRAGWEG